MVVLSLFDGISCGQIALERAGIKVDKYYASEIEPNAIKVTQYNFPNTIQLGDIEKWKDWEIDPPDIIIGGSPCQGFSFAGMRLNFNDPRSKLFFTYAKILEHYHPKYFLLENVLMEKKHQDVISRTLGKIYPEYVEQADFFGDLYLEPYIINSCKFSAQNRKRLYWTNIEIHPITDSGILLVDILEKGIIDPGISEKLVEYIINKKGKPNNTLYRKSKCFTAGANSGGTHSDMDLIYDKGRYRKLTVTECCRLQTLPDSYCSVISKTQAYKAIGNGWTVDVIAHIFKGLKQ